MRRPRYYFGADSGDKVGTLFQTALSGLTAFDRTADRESISAYRFHNHDPLVMSGGGRLTWQVGCEGHANATKCGNPAPAGGLPPSEWRMAGVGRSLSPVNVTTYAWVYVFPSPPS
jgi:hypothetical protein